MTDTHRTSGYGNFMLLGPGPRGLHQIQCKWQARDSTSDGWTADASFEQHPPGSIHEMLATPRGRMVALAPFVYG